MQSREIVSGAQDDDIRDQAASPSVLKLAAIKCGKCYKSFTRPENLTRHIRATHTRLARYHCSQCEKRFTRSDLLKKHVKIHSLATTTVNTPTSKFSEVVNQSANESSIHSDALSGPGGDYTSSLQELENRRNAHEFGTQQNHSGTHVLPQTGYQPHDQSLQSQAGPQSEFMNYGGLQGFGEGLFDADLTWTFDYLLATPQSTATQGVNDSAIAQASRHKTTDASSATTSAAHHPDEERQADWPDGQSRPASPGRSETSLRFNLATFVQPSELDETQQLRQRVPRKCTDLLLADLQAVFASIQSPELHHYCGAGPQASEYLNLQTARYFLLLYFIHVNPRFPVIHVPTFQPRTCCSELLLAMLMSGSCHSVSNQGRFCLAYIERARIVVTLGRERSSDYLKSIENIHALLLLSLVGIWTGEKEAYRRADADRGVIVSACRRSRLLDCRVIGAKAQHKTATYGKNKLTSSWNRWIDTECRKRLGLSIYLLDCQITALLQRQPYISKAETANMVLPCHAMYWDASSAEAWKALLGTADTPPSFYHLPTLTSILLRHEVVETINPPDIDQFSRTLYAYILHTHIFEWRQAMCMLNTTSLTESPISLVTKHIGPGLLDRQRWLFSILDAWYEVYGLGEYPKLGMEQSAGGILLYHLGHLALRINFSDLHVVAGRSGAHEDVLIAAESLRNRLSSNATPDITQHVSQMLKVAFHVVETGGEHQYSFEVTVCLFMGGLIYWSMHHTLKQQELSDCITVIRGQFSTIMTPGLLGSTSGITDEQAMLMHHIHKIIDALRSIHCLRFASIFASVLEKLCCREGQITS